MCKYMLNQTTLDDCSGNGACDVMFTGQCTCNPGFRGADCSEPVVNLFGGYTATIGFQGSQTQYFQYDAGVRPQDQFELKFSNANPFDVYISAGLGSDATEFNNDIEIKGQTYTKITSKAFPFLQSSFVVQVRVNGIDFANNAYLESVFLVDFKRISPQTETVEAEKVPKIQPVQSMVEQAISYATGYANTILSYFGK